MPKLKWNILNVSYGVNFKYEGMILHSFDRFYVETKFELPKIEDLHLTTIQFDSTCSYLDAGKGKRGYPTVYILNLRVYCERLCLLWNFYKKQVDYYNCIAYEILTKESG